LCLVLFPGCFSVILISPEELRQDSDRGVRVELKDGRIVNFAAGDYTVQADSLGPQAITGKGTLYRENKSRSTVPFDSTLTLTDVRSITKSRPNAVFFILLGVSLAVIAAAISLRGITMH